MSNASLLLIRPALNLAGWEQRKAVKATTEVACEDLLTVTDRVPMCVLSHSADPGPIIAERRNQFVTPQGETVLSEERWFRLHLPAFALDTTRHTELEREIMQDHRWFARAELSNWHEPIFPPELLSLLDRPAP